MSILTRFLVAILMLVTTPALAQFSPPLGIQDEGGSISRPVNVVDCVGGGIECTFSVNKATISVDAGAGSGDVTGVGDCATGACLDGTSDGGTNITLYDAAGNTYIDAGAASYFMGGNVGIGSSVPAYLLDVNGTANFSGDVTGISLSELEDPTGNVTFSMGSSTLTFTNSNPVGGILFDLVGAGSSHYFEVRQETGNPAANTHLVHLQADDVDVVPLHIVHPNSPTNGYLLIDTVSGNGGDIFNIKSDGNVGVGSFAPAQKLDVLGNISVSGTVDGVDIAARDHDAVTLSGTPNYITLSGQDIIRAKLDLADDVNTFTEAQLEANLSDVTALFTNNVTGDVTVSGATSAITAGVIVNADINASAAIDVSKTALVAGNALTISTNTLNFDGGASPSGDLGGTWASPTVTGVQADSVALTTDTTGNYVSSATANQGLTLTGTEGASLGLQDCAANQILKRNAGDTAWECAADATGSGSLGTNLSSTTDDILSDNGTILLGGTGGTNNEALDFDFETTANAVGVSSTTSATTIDFGTLIIDQGRVQIDGTTCLDVSSDQIFHDTDCDGTKDAGEEFIDQTGGAGGGVSNYTLPAQSAKITGVFVTDGDATQGAQIDAGEGNWRLLFDNTTDEAAVWQFVMPDNYSSAPTLDVHYTMASATTGTVEFEGAVMCVSDGDAADVGTASFSTIAVGSATVPGTAGHADKISITLTDDSCAVGDMVWIYLSTDADDGTNDTATGDREVIGVEFGYTSS